MQQLADLPAEASAYCTHHWFIDTPSPGKQTVLGSCSNCGKIKSFSAFGEDNGFSWMDEAHQTQSYMTRNST